ncbi:MAG: glucoamylase family protein [Candidatus Hadarchaeales archaeon]
MKFKDDGFIESGSIWVERLRGKIGIAIILICCVVAGAVAIALIPAQKVPSAPSNGGGGGNQQGDHLDQLNDWTQIYSFEVLWENMKDPYETTITWDDLSEEDKEFLDNVQKNAFWYFWYEADPDTGLVQDRATNEEVSSTAAVGFGLSAICIAESRGWITYEEAYERVLNTLKSFDPSNPLVRGSHGFFYHWINTKTGRREWNSEISLIDTSLLVAGVLHAGKHFAGTEIETLADQIYRAVEWDWMSTGNLLKITSDGGGKSGYDEYIICYILALGSPTHPVPERYWDAWARTYKWYEYNGTRFLTAGGRTMLAYLYQFPAAWIDFRGVHDKYANYWLESIAALKVNRDFCLDESNRNGWDPLWGWTACDGKDGYLGFRDYFEGTVAPSAVAASLPFIPEDALAMLKYMYQRYGDRIWGEYGFVNSFNPVLNWYDNDYIGIDQGNLVLMIEAFRSGNVWKDFMSIPYIVEGMRKAGFVSGYHTDNQGFIKDWLLIGPFGTGESEAFETDFIGETSIGFPRAGETIEGKTWIGMHYPYGDSSSRFINLYNVFIPRENTGAYAYALINSAEEKQVTLRVGSDDSIKVWINDELVHENHALRSATKDQDVIEGIRLQAGFNKILVKVCNESGGWGFYLRFTDKT